MTTHPCRTCGHVEQIVVWTRGKIAPEKARHERCIHPAGPHPMHEPCAWAVTKREGSTE